MIECSSLRLPPQGCLQYLTGATGTVSSFNYRAGCTSHPCTHLQNQLYTVINSPKRLPLILPLITFYGKCKVFSFHLFKICVRQESGYCVVGWRDENDENFRMSRDPAAPHQKSGVTLFAADWSKKPAVVFAMTRSSPWHFVSLYLRKDVKVFRFHRTPLI